MSFLCRVYIFRPTTDISSRVLWLLPTFSVNYIISIIMIYSYNHRSRRIPSKYCFEKFVCIIFPYMTLSHHLFLRQLKMVLAIATTIPYLRLQYFWSNQYLSNTIFAISWIFDTSVILCSDIVYCVI